MISLMLGALVSSCLCFWGVSSISFGVVTILAIFLLNQSFSMSFNYVFMSSNISNLMVFLSILLCFLSVLSTPEEKSSSYLFWIGALGVVLIAAFSSPNIIFFYVFFEASLIPTLVLIIGWGYQPERLQAGSYMMLYTVAASLPLLVILVWRCFSVSSSCLPMLMLMEFQAPAFLMLVIYGAFLVKLPMYSFHLWLPKAHVEAPLAGSMILAGILLKLGGYGLMQMNKSFSLGGFGAPAAFVIGVSMWGGFIATLMCLRQIDMKALVAYSSVGHMGIVSAGVLLDRSWGMTSALITMLAHGLSSSALFCLAYFTYKKAHTRGLPYLGGFLTVYPILSLFWFIFCCINMAAPPTINLLGELTIVPALWSSSGLLVLVMGLLVFFSAAYNMYLYTSINHGGGSKFNTSSTPMQGFEMVSMAAHLAPLLILFKSQIFCC
uniref:NADH-ubiquinone oxidoreductase chain 4 n=1 Tax=Trimusculus reticulatus TaxID=981059 RepID=G8HTG2_9EUPU|nr:NADH dehydrogenase subunit 4 [Trimusculus reticulatus]AEQ93938.1 NADH dehydrogenase subunit 4 [Trimusculus reticulatus]